MLNLDTHILVHALAGTLKPQEELLLTLEPWCISGIVLWEIAKLCEIGRLDLDIHSAEFARALSRIHVWPVDLAVCRELRSLDFSSDPADEIIAATSLVHGVPLVTRDRVIPKSKRVPFPVSHRPAKPLR